MVSANYQHTTGCFLILFDYFETALIQLARSIVLLCKDLQAAKLGEVHVQRAKISQEIVYCYNAEPIVLERKKIFYRCYQ